MSIIPSGQKFRTADASVDTTERRSAKLNNMIEFYTMADIVGTVSSQITLEGAADASTIFNTVVGMVADSSLVDGNVVETRGYTTAGDGGATVYTVSATGTSDGGSVIALTNGLFAVTDFGGVTCPTQWGAVKNDSASSSENVTAYNSMFRYVESIGGDKCSVNISTGVYHLNATVKLPQSIVQAEVSFLIEFNNSELKATASNITLLQRDYLSAQESSKVSILNCDFTGSGFTGVTGVDIQGGYNCQISNGDFTGLAKGIELGFALNSHMYNLKFTNCLRGVNIGLLGGTNPNKQSNVSTMFKCRFYSSKATDYALYIDRVSGVVVEDCIFEGHQPTVANIMFDGQSSVVNDCTIVGCHAETAGHADSGNNTHVINTGGASLKLHRVFAQATNTHVDPDNIVGGREIIWHQGGEVDISLYYYEPTFSFRIDSDAGFYMFDKMLNDVMPNDTSEINFTGTIGEPLYFAIDRSSNGLSHSRGRAFSYEDTGGGYRHNHQLRSGGVDDLKAVYVRNWAFAYAGNKDASLRGKTYYQRVAFDQKVGFTNRDLNITTATPTDLNGIPGQQANQVTMHLESGETGLHEQTLCPASGRPTVYTSTAAPSTVSDPGKKGEIRTDASNMYICIADNTWVKSALTSF
jgi:hypothetical protein